MAKLELLSPAGDMERLEMAVRYGADAVYLAGTSFGRKRVGCRHLSGGQPCHLPVYR